MDDEIPLTGGNVSDGVVRVGGTVRRPAGPSTAAVHALLDHLRDAGFTGVPRPLGFDERGREVLSFVPGEPVFPDRTALYAADAGLAGIGRFVRALHDVLAGFVPPVDAVWRVVIPDVGNDLVVHHDLGPWNVLHSPRHGWGLIDWDGAGPGTREWELAYVAQGFVPLVAGAVPITEQSRRLRALVDAYGLDDAGRERLLDLLPRRPRAMFDLLAGTGDGKGVEPWARLWRDGHGDTWRANASHVAEHAQMWRRALLG